MADRVANLADPSCRTSHWRDATGREWAWRGSAWFYLSAVDGEWSLPPENLGISVLHDGLGPFTRM